MPTAKQTSKLEGYFPPTGTSPVDEFIQNNRSYQLFKAKGLDKNDAGFDERRGMDGRHWSTVEKILEWNIYRRLLSFLNQVDPAKGPIKRRVTRLERRRDLDPNSLKNQEYLVVHTEWIATDYLGNQLVSPEVLEGMYNEPVTQTTIVNGRRVTQYQNWVARYDIPFTPETVNKALENQLNPPEFVNYFVRVSKTQRDNTFSLEQFRDSTFEQCQQISKDGKGANR